MKVLMLNGSPRAKGNTATALAEMVKIFIGEGIAVETVQVGNLAVRGCVSCYGCFEKGQCVFDDVINELASKFREANAQVEARMMTLEEIWMVWLAWVGSLIRSGSKEVSFLPREILSTLKEVRRGVTCLALGLLSKPTTFTSLGTWIFLALRAAMRLTATGEWVVPIQ